MNFENATVLSLEKVSNYFDSEYIFSTQKNLSIQGIFHAPEKTEGVKEIQDDLESFIISTDGKLHDIIINGHDFGKGKVTGFSSGSDNSVRLKEYSVDVVIYEAGDLANLTGESNMEAFEGLVSDPNRKFIQNISESFSFSKNAGAYNYTHDLEIQFVDHGDESIDSPIDLAKTLAKTILETDVDFGFLDDQVGGFYDLPHKKYYSETYNKINKQCSFGEQYSQPAVTQLNYSSETSHSLSVGGDGILSIEESGQIKALVDTSPSILRGYLSTEVGGSFARCQEFAESFNDGLFENDELDGSNDTDFALVSQHAQLSRSVDNFNRTGGYSISYTNNSTVNVGYVAERDISVDVSNEIVTLTESGDIIGLGDLAYDEDIVSFNGSTNKISVGGEFDLTSDLTISTWVKINVVMGGASKNMEIIGNETLNVDGFKFRIIDDVGSDWGKVFFRVNESGQNRHIETSFQAFPNDQQWHHVAVTKSGANGVIYIDGQSVGTSSNLIDPVSAVNQTYIGASFSGYMADIRAYNTGLSAANIDKLNKKLFTGNKSNLKLHYDFNLESEIESGDGDARIPDLSNNDNTGTLDGATIAVDNIDSYSGKSRYELAQNAYKTNVLPNIESRLSSYYSDLFSTLSTSLKKIASAFTSDVPAGKLSYSQKYSNDPTAADDNFRSVTSEESVNYGVQYKNDFKIVASGQALEQYRDGLLTPATKSVRVNVKGKRTSTEAECKTKALAMGNAAAPESKFNVHLTGLGYSFSEKDRTYSLNANWQYYESGGKVSDCNVDFDSSSFNKIDGLVSLWRMDEVSSGAVVDMWGNNDGTRSWSDASTGKHGSCFNFSNGKSVDFGRGEGCPVSGYCIEPDPVYAPCLTPSSTASASTSPTPTLSASTSSTGTVVPADPPPPFFYGPFPTPSASAPVPTASSSDCVNLINCPICGWDEILKSEDFSISLWFKPLSNEKTLLKKYFQTSLLPGRDRDNSFVLYDGIYQEANGDTTSFTKGTIGEWNHMVVSCSNVSSAWQSGIRIYLNGTKVKDVVDPVFDKSNVTTLIAGGDYAGCMDDLRVYNRALMSSEISLIHKGEDLLPDGRSPYIPQTPTSTASPSSSDS